MASISKDKQGNKTIQFMGADRKRRSIRIGKIPAKDATTIKTHIESILAANFSGNSCDRATSEWLGRIDAALYGKLANAGLVQKRKKIEQHTLGVFIDSYIKGRTDVKRGTAIAYQQTRRCLIAKFGSHKPLDEITSGDADDWRRWLVLPIDREKPEAGGQGLADNTARRRCGIARQFFRDAERRRLITESPFAHMKGIAVRANRDRDYFLTRSDADKMLKACPDAEWKLLFVLSRYGGLRCPSEHMALRWGDINWERGRIVVRASKTEHHEGKGVRIIPLFHEIRPYLQAVLDEFLAEFDPKLAKLSEQFVISRHRTDNCNLRTQFERIITKAGLVAWPKLFQNLRASRATELAGEHPGHVAAEWLGHSTAVADKHYWQTTDDDFARALQNPVQQPNGTERNEAHEHSGEAVIPLECASLRSGAAQTGGLIGSLQSNPELRFD